MQEILVGCEYMRDILCMYTHTHTHKCNVHFSMLALGGESDVFGYSLLL